MFADLSTKLVNAKVVISWLPDSDFLPTGVTFRDDTSSPIVTIELYEHSTVKDPDPTAMLMGSPQLTDDAKGVKQLVVGGMPGAKYVIEFLADFSDGVQRDGVKALLEVE